MKVREIINKIEDKGWSRSGHYLIKYFSNLDKEYNDVVDNSEYWDMLKRVVKEYNIDVNK